MAVAMEVAWRAGGGGGAGELGSAATSSSSTPPGVSIQDIEASLKLNDIARPPHKMNKRAWGDDAHKLVQLMMNPLQQQQQQQQQLQQLHEGGELEDKKVADEEEQEVTLDLLGPSSPPTKLQKLDDKDQVDAQEVRKLERREAELESRSPEFLELEPADQPVPSGWEKCLDLKTGKLYFVNKSTRMTNSPEINSPCCKHEFLNPKLKSSAEKVEEAIQAPSCPQLAPISPKPPLLAFSTGSKQLWNLQLNVIKPPGDHHHPKDQKFSNSTFELDLNLTASGTTSPSHHQSSQQHVEQLPPDSNSAAVCTMEMVQRALNRAEKAMGKREMQAPKNSHHHHSHHHPADTAASASSPKSTHFGAMSEATAAASTSSWSPNSTTSSSNSSPTSSRSTSGLLGGSGATTKGETLGVLKEEQVDNPLAVTSEIRACEGEDSKGCSLEKKGKEGKDSKTTEVAEQKLMLVMGACTRCLMYVMLNKCDPKCPRCGSQVPLDFTNATK